MTDVKLTKTDRNLLRRIRRMVAATHWTKGEYFESADEYGTDKDMYCLVGFVNKVTGLKDEDLYLDSTVAERTFHFDEKRNEYRAEPMPAPRTRLIAALREAIKVKAPRAGGIESFNDRPSTKREDILEVLDLAIGEEDA